MERFPQELAHAFAGVFPRGDPYTSVWDQSEVNALERSADEDQHSDSAAMSAMYALMKTFGGLERCLGRLSGSLITVQDEKRQLRREFDSEVERLQAELVLGILNIITKSRLSSKSSNGAKNAKPIPHTT